MAHPCDLCRGSELGTPCRDAIFTYTDAFGFVYRLCETHHASVLTGLQQAVRNRTKRKTAVPSLARAGTPRRAWRDRPKHGPFATGAEQRRAREVVGWSLRQLARELGGSYSQLQSAESGRRPVDPEVAAWVRGVLDGGATPDVEGQVRRELGRVFAKEEAEEAQR